MNVGIDFGTTNSSIAFQRSPRQAPECASVDRYGNTPFDVLLRTAVLLDDVGNVVSNGIGAVALDPAAWKDPKTGDERRRLANIKPFLRTFQLREQWPVQRTRIDWEHYDHLRQEPLAVTYKELVDSGELACSREELLEGAAAVFRKLLGSLPESVRNQEPSLVIGVPLTFPDFAKKRLLDIVVRSGALESEEPYRESLRRVRFLPEPVAASLFYADECETRNRRSAARVLVFDAGGGTLDLALLEFCSIGGEYRPVKQLALASRELAGRRYDQCIEEFGLRQYRDRLMRWNSSSPNAREVVSWQLEQAAESIKIALSTREEHRELSLIGAGVAPTVTRAEFEGWVSGVVDETTAFVSSTVDAAALLPDEIDTVVMVGGSSLIPCVQKAMERLFPSANVVCEDPRQTGRGDGVERALTAVSRGLALYDEAVARQGITPFGYGFWDAASRTVIPAAPKWSTHDSSRPVVTIEMQSNERLTSLTLVQEMVAPERVLNVLNVPTSISTAGATAVSVQVRTSDSGLYPDVVLVDPATCTEKGELRVRDLPERTLRDLITNDQHVVRWNGDIGRGHPDTPYPEIVTLARGNPVRFRRVRDDGSEQWSNGVIERIRRISDGLFYEEVGHWDLTRWVFHIRVGETGLATFHPNETTDIQLDRRGKGPNGRSRYGGSA